MRHAEQTSEQAVERAVDGRLATLWAREGTRILIVLLGMFGGLAWDGLKGDMADFKTEQDTQGESISDIKSDVRDLNTRLDQAVIRQVDTNTKSIEKLDERVQRLERVTPVP